MTERNSGFKAKNAGMSVALIMAMIISGFAVIAAPVTIAQDENMGGPYGGELRVALKSAPSSLNPLAANLNESANQLIDILYEPLGRIDPFTLQNKPWLASSWTVNATHQNIVTVVLKQGIHWHDGTEVTLADIAYTFGSHGYNLAYVASMTTDTASHTIVFNLTAPDSRFFSELLLKKIVPNGFTATSAPKGCGPFKLVSTNATTTVVEAFDDHFNARPYIDRMIYTYYPWNENYNANAYPYNQNFPGGIDPRFDGFYRAAYDLITDKVDYIGWDLTTNQTGQNIEVAGNNTQLLFNANSTLVRSSGLKQWYLGFNNAPGHLLNDPALRKAISYGINKESLIVYDISGGLEKSDSIISKYNLPWYNSTITPHGYNEATSRQILDAAHYMDYNSDGYIDKPGPVTPNVGYENISLTLFGPSNEDTTPYVMSTNIITWFEILGIKVNLVSNTTDVHMPNIISNNFDMYLSTEDAATLDPQFINGLYDSSSIASNKNLLNFEGKYKVSNYSLTSQITDNTTWTANLGRTCLTDPILVYHNDTLVANASWSVDRNTGIFTLAPTFVMDYANDTLNITYSYRPFDHYARMANSQMNQTVRANYIKDAQAVLADLEPSIPLFTYKVNHAYRPGMYIGWIQTLGGINNYWSFTSIQNQIIGDSAVTLSSVKNYLNDGEQMNLFVKVQDLNGGPVTDSQFAFTGEGTFGTPEYDAVGQQYTVAYTAPATTVTRTITLTVFAYTMGYTSSSDTLDITVHPQVNTMSIDISRGATSLPSGNTTSISVVVTDNADSTALNGATVVLTMTPTGLGGYIEEVTGTTNSAGEFVTTFGSHNITVDTTFRITAYVTKDGYVDAVQTTSISVSRDPNIESTTDRGFLGLPAPSFMTVLVLLAGMAVAYSVYRRKRD